MHHAGVMHLTVTRALGNLLAQIRQPNIGTVTRNQILLSILTSSPAFLAQKSRTLPLALMRRLRWHGTHNMMLSYLHESNCPSWRWSNRCKKHFK